MRKPWVLKWNWTLEGIRGNEQLECDRPSELYYALASLMSLEGVNFKNIKVVSPGGAVVKYNPALAVKRSVELAQDLLKPTEGE